MVKSWLSLGGLGEDATAEMGSETKLEIWVRMREYRNGSDFLPGRCLFLRLSHAVIIFKSLRGLVKVCENDH